MTSDGGSDVINLNRPKWCIVHQKCVIYGKHKIKEGVAGDKKPQKCDSRNFELWLPYSQIQLAVKKIIEKKEKQLVEIPLFRCYTELTKQL